MKICVISTTILSCPPKGYSGLEQLAYQQAEGLAKRGHEVLLIAPTGSVPPPGVELHMTTIGESERQAYSGYWNRLPVYDAVIDNSWEKWSYILKIEGKLPQPILGVCHAPANTMYKVPPPVPKPCLIAISKDQAAAMKECWNIDAEVAYNGVDPEFYKPGILPRTDRYLFLARISSIKGPQIAVDVCRRMNVGLDIVGDDRITGEPELAKSIRASCDGVRAIYHGGVDRDIAVGFFQRAKALLHMNRDFREPFGLAPVEAMMCGCPVIAWFRGAMRETVAVGTSGFLVSSEEEVDRIIQRDLCNLLNQEDIRNWAMRFSVNKMIDRYEELIVKALANGGW